MSHEKSIYFIAIQAPHFFLRKTLSFAEGHRQDWGKPHDQWTLQQRGKTN